MPHQYYLYPHIVKSAQEIPRSPDGTLVAAIGQKMVMNGHNAASSLGSLCELCLGPCQLLVVKPSAVYGQRSGRIETHYAKSLRFIHHCHIGLSGNVGPVSFQRA
jgi:hypothetical protein